jgi:cell division GTPase FtsZ
VQNVTRLGTSDTPASGQALDAINNLRKSVDTLIIIPNDRLLSAVGKNTPVKEAFNVADDILRQGVRGICDIITVRARARRPALHRERGHMVVGRRRPGAGRRGGQRGWR